MFMNLFLIYIYKSDNDKNLLSYKMDNPVKISVEISQNSDAETSINRPNCSQIIYLVLFISY